MLEIFWTVRIRVVFYKFKGNSGFSYGSRVVWSVWCVWELKKAKEVRIWVAGWICGGYRLKEMKIEVD